MLTLLNCLMYMSSNRRKVLAAASAVILLSACGGGAEEPSSKTLYAAYDVVTSGNSLSQLMALVGYEPELIHQEDGSLTTYTWVAERGTTIETRMLVVLRKDKGVVRKTVIGPSGNRTESY